MTQLTVPDSSSFAPEYTLDCVPGVGTVHIGKDLRLYRKTKGLMAIVAPCEPVKDSKPGVWLEGVEWGEFPPMGQIKYLNRIFLSKYQKEVLVLVGRRWDETGWFFMVPKQRGDAYAISWDDKEGSQWFLKHGRYIGSVHIHPGSNASPSTVDTTWWATREASGLHMIIGRTGNYTITGSCAGHVIQLAEGNLEEGGDQTVPEEKGFLCTSLNRAMSELLLEPLPVVTPCYRQLALQHSRLPSRSLPELKGTVQEDWSYRVVCDVIANEGGLFFAPQELDGMRVITLANGMCAIVTAAQWLQIAHDLLDFQVKLPPHNGIAEVGKRKGDS